MKPGSTGGAKLKQRRAGLKSWEIWTLEGHSCVLISNQRGIEQKQKVVLLKCQTPYAGDPPANEFETVLDEEDGLQRPTVCACDLMLAARKTEISQKRGVVSLERRRDISRKMIQALAVAGM